MREYAKVRSRFWTRGTGKRLPPLAKLVAQNLMSCQSGNMIGLYYLPVALLADETGLTREEALEALGKCLEEGFARYDHETSCVWVVNAAREQLLGEDEDRLKPTDNRVRGVEKLLKGLEDHPFYSDFVSHYAEILCLGKYVPPEQPGRPRKAPHKASPSPSRAPLEPVSSEQREVTPPSEEGNARESALPAAAPVETPQAKTAPVAALPTDLEAFSSGPYFAAFREAFASEALAMGFRPAPEPHYSQLRAGSRRAGMLARVDGKPFAECASLLCRAALEAQRATGKSAGLALLDIEPGTAAALAPPARPGRLQPTRGTTHEDFAHAPSEQDQLAAVRAHRQAKASHGT